MYVNLIGSNVYLFKPVDDDAQPVKVINDEFESTFTPLNKNKVKTLLTDWFREQLRLIKDEHVMPCWSHIGNMYYDGKLRFVRHGFEHFDIVERNIIPTEDVAYMFDPTNELKLFKYDKEMKLVTTFDLTDDEVEEVFIVSLLWWADETTKMKQLHDIITALYGIDVCVDLHKQVMKKINFKHQQVIVNMLTNSLFFHAEKALKNWLGGPFGSKCSSHKIFSYMTVCKDKFAQLWKDVDYPNNPIFKLSRDEFWKWRGDINNTTSNIYRQLAYMLFLGYNPFDEFRYMLSYVYTNMKKVKTIYRCETTNRFTNDDLSVGKTIYWENLIPGTEHKEYALSYLNNARGSNFMSFDGENMKHILFVFNNINATHLKSYYSNYTTYVRSYNAKSPEDTNRLNCFHPCAVMVSNEYIIEPFKKFTITKVSTIETNEVIGIGLVTKNPTKDITVTDKKLHVTVVELE